MPAEQFRHKPAKQSRPPRTAVETWSGPAVLLLIALGYLFLSDSRTFGPTWFPPVVLVLAVVTAVLAEAQGAHQLRRRLVLASNALVTVALVIGAGFLIYGMALYSERPVTLLRDALLLWTLNILTFALWYWELDNGGPYQRWTQPYRTTDLLFPQKQLDAHSTWVPTFVDYLFLAFNTNTAFSPTDTLALSHKVKLAMMLQSMIALVDVAVIVARAVSSLRS